MRLHVNAILFLTLSRLTYTIYLILSKVLVADKRIYSGLKKERIYYGY